MTGSLYNQQRPLFSIVTVTLNAGKDLEDTVKSVLDQDYDDYELIIKDGGSTDGTEKLTWSNPRVKRHTSRDSGIFDAMNQALKLAIGEYVCFLNAGDLLFRTNVLFEVADAVRHHPEAEFLYGHVHKQMSRSGYEIYPKRLSRYFLFTNMICHQAWFVKKAVYVRYGGLETMYYSGADYRLFLKMIARDSIPYHFVPHVVVSYKGGGLSCNRKALSEFKHSTTELKHKLFSPKEYLIYSFIQSGRNVLKRIFYDFLLWHLWCKWQRFKADQIMNETTAS